MFMRHPAYLGEDSGNQAIAGESSRILKQFWGNRKIVSHWLSETPNPLPHTRLELEARVEIGRLMSDFQGQNTRFHSGIQVTLALLG
jgi:hypothetical protein